MKSLARAIRKGSETLSLALTGRAQLADLLEPERLGYSPKMTNLMGAILGYDYGARDERGNQWVALSITSDGFVTAQTRPVSSGAFIGSVADLDRNVRDLLNQVKMTDQQSTLFWSLYREHVTDWRPGRGQR